MESPIQAGSWQAFYHLGERKEWRRVDMAPDGWPKGGIWVVDEVTPGVDTGPKAPGSVVEFDAANVKWQVIPLPKLPATPVDDAGFAHPPYRSDYASQRLIAWDMKITAKDALFGWIIEP